MTDLPAGVLAKTARTWKTVGADGDRVTVTIYMPSARASAYERSEVITLNRKLIFVASNATDVGVKQTRHVQAENNPVAEVDSVSAKDTRELLHVGCGASRRDMLPEVFRRKEWHETRLDIDPEVHPDFVASITDMHMIPDDKFDAVYSSHNVEHLYPHEVQSAVREMRRVLKPFGFAFIMVPDLQEVARYIAEGILDEPLYLSPMGPIAPIDILFGHTDPLWPPIICSWRIVLALLRARLHPRCLRQDSPLCCCSEI